LESEELKYQSIDSTFIEDINGSEDASYSNVYKRRKGESSKGIKITSIVSQTLVCNLVSPKESQA
jgi:hypothetical protein